MSLELEIIKTSGKSLGKLSIDSSSTVKDLKKEIAKKFRIAIERQAIRNAPKGQTQCDVVVLGNLELENNRIYVKDLGPQIGWDTVFFLEYAGPIVVYGLVFLLPKCFYSNDRFLQSSGRLDVFPFNLGITQGLNGICGGAPLKVQESAYTVALLWTLHYGKRIFETAFIHRFSHGTMPISNLFKNCGYYWGFAFFVAYNVNDPLRTQMPSSLYYLGIFLFLFCEMGNLSTHILLRNLRPAGTTDRKIPVPDANPFNLLFSFVSCPNYTYEFGSWVGFTLLTGCWSVLIFGLAGLYQMTIWAIGKHKRYCKEFPNYPRQRKAIIPFII